MLQALWFAHIRTSPHLNCPQTFYKDINMTSHVKFTHFMYKYVLFNFHYDNVKLYIVILCLACSY